MMNDFFYKHIELFFWVKRVICGLCAILFLWLGVNFAGATDFFTKILGLCFFIGGISLTYVTIMQQFPRYNFWITLTAIILVYVLYVVHISPSAEEKELISSRLDAELEKSKYLMGKTTNGSTRESPMKKHNKKGRTFDLTAYPKIIGSITVIDAHIYYIGGRYIRLFGVDAPDSDQICADARGTAYNCGEEAASWIRGWVDKNQIACYILKVVPNGYDLATCVWGEYDIGAALVASGWGLANTKETTIYKPYEVKAQNDYSGLWQGTFYSPEDWRDIKRHRRDFKINHRSVSKKSSFFNFGSLF